MQMGRGCSCVDSLRAPQLEGALLIIMTFSVPTEQPHSHREDETVAYLLPTDRIDAEHFRIGEFKCPDGTPVVLLHPALLHHLDRLRNRFGVVRVTSGFRTGQYNEKIGGVEDSRHLYGLAADVTVQSVSPLRVAEWAREEGFGGVGLYHRFVHLDVWGQDRRWDRT